MVDLETTGLHAGGHDRVVEVAVVRMRPDWSIEDEFVTLINPGRDVGRADIHGITATDVLHAPVFAEAAGEIAERLEGAILAGHNARFDCAFLAAEFARVGTPMPPWPTVCTLALAYELLDEPPSRKLAYCCQEAGIRLDDAHHALGDARATARLLTHYLEEAAREGRTNLEHLGCRCLELPGPGWGPPRGASRRLTRAQAVDATKLERQYLARLVQSLSADDAADLEQAEYMTLLDRALLDRRVSREEADTLVQVAQMLGLSRSSVHAAHERYLKSLVAEALADGLVTSAERSDLMQVAEMLSVDAQAVERLLSEPQQPAQSSATSTPGELTGKSVCFTGAMEGTIDGKSITREAAERLAAAAGLVVLPRVTKKLDILVVTDPNTASSKAQKAREYGTTVMAAAVFWRSIGVRVS